MSNVFTITGNLTADPELRFTPGGHAVVNFTIADTPRKLNKTTNEWEDGETLFMRCSLWRDAAEHVAESLVRGARVVATGKLASRSYTTKEGEKRTVIDMDVDEVGPSLKNATAKPVKAARGGGMAVTPAQGGFAPQQPAQDPWASPAQPSFDEPPF